MSSALTDIARLKLDRWAKEAYPSNYLKVNEVLKNATNVQKCPETYKITKEPQAKKGYEKLNHTYAHGNNFCVPNDDKQTPIAPRKKITDRTVIRQIEELLPETQGIRARRREALQAIKNKQEDAKTRYKTAEKAKHDEKNKKKLLKIYAQLYPSDSESELQQKVTEYLENVKTCAAQTKCDKNLLDDYDKGCIEILPATDKLGAVCAPKEMEKFFNDDERKQNKRGVRAYGEWWQNYYNDYQACELENEMKKKNRYAALRGNIHPGKNLQTRGRQ